MSTSIWLAIGASWMVGCGSPAKPLVTGGPTTPPPADPAVPQLRVIPIEPPPAPKVGSPAVLSTDERKPPIVLLIDARGLRRLAAAASWADLGAGRLLSIPKAAGPEASWRHIRESFLLRKDPAEAVESFHDYRTEHELGTDDTRTGRDDPPPPEDGDDDESGGTGTAMALEEGKMGRSSTSTPRGPRSEPAADPSSAVRQSSIVGEVTDDKLDSVPAIVVADPSTKAYALVEAVQQTQGSIGVAYQGAIRPLRIQFSAQGGQQSTWDWLEVRLDAKGLTVEAVPSEAIEVPWTEVGAKLASALGTARGRRNVDPAAPVDVLVTRDVDVQHLVDVLVALEGTGGKLIGLGSMPDAAQLALRGHQNPRVAVGQPNAMGDLDKSVIRASVKSNIKRVQYCYEKALLTKPNLQGTVQVQFFIRPDGKVAQATASGVDPMVSSCVASVIKGILFPKPKGGGGVQVNYPFTFRQ